MPLCQDCLNQAETRVKVKSIYSTTSICDRCKKEFWGTIMGICSKCYKEGETSLITKGYNQDCCGQKY